MSDKRRDGDKELFETIGQVKEFMENYQRDRATDQAARAQDREESRNWREEFASEQEAVKTNVQGLKDRVDSLTAPARWVVGLAALITTFGVLAAYAKKFFFWIKATFG